MKAYAEGDSVGGRQMIKIMLEFWKNESSLNVMHSYSHLQEEFPWLGGERIGKFYENGNNLLTTCRSDIEMMS